MSILRNSAWNGLGLIVPSLLLIPAFGVYSRVLGVELLGVLTLTFTIVGFAGSLDLGLSRSLIRQVSMHQNNVGLVKLFMGTTAIFVLGLSVLVAVLIIVYSQSLVDFLGISRHHSSDVQIAFYWLALTIPPYLLTLVGTAFFEGIENFRSINILRCVSGILSAITGVAAVLWIPSLASVLAALCFTRWLFCLVVFWLYVREINRLDDVRRPALRVFSGSALKQSLSYGGWLTVTNIVGPLVTYFDRFALSNMYGASVVAYYTVPAEIIGRLSIIPAAIARSLFPRLSKQLNNSNGDRRAGLVITCVSLIITILPTFIFAKQILGLWMGPEYTGDPVAVLRILLVGLFFNALANGPSIDLQARGHSKVAAYIHLFEVIPYIAAFVLLTQAYGIIGTALAWSGRMLVEYILMTWCSRNISGTRYSQDISENLLK